jgi:hypothetical protein
MLAMFIAIFKTVNIFFLYNTFLLNDERDQVTHIEDRKND